MEVSIPVYLSGARVVKQKGDNSCLFHSLSYCLSYDDIYDSSSGFCMREMIANFIRDNEDTVICIAPNEHRTLSEAVAMDGLTCSSYSARMNVRTEWGTVIEIATAAEMFLIGIRVYVPVPRKRSFRLLGSYRCIGYDANTREICLLYSGNCHYDSIVDWSDVSHQLVSADADNSYINLDSQLRSFEAAYMSMKGKELNSKELVCAVQSSRKRDASGNQAQLDDGALCGISNNRRPKVMPVFRGLVRNLELTHVQKKANRKMRIEKRSATRKSLPTQSMRSSALSTDASSFSKNYDILTRFIVCGICGLEGPSAGCKLIADMQAGIDASGLKEKFIALTTETIYSSKYDKLFIAELLLVFENGIIKGLTHMCGSCCNDIKGKKKPSHNTSVFQESDGDVISNCGGNVVECNNDVEMIQDDECTTIDVLSVDVQAVRDPIISRMGHVSKFPKFALFAGLFAGNVPVELVGLTSVEESMINIYSSVTKMFLAGGKHYKVKGGTSYTIINDLSSVAKFLPRMPSIEDIAVMRHKKTVVGRDYTYRPFRVYSALNWLKEHNHLYADVELKWHDNVKYWQDTISPVDIPYIEITDEEVLDIDNDTNEDGIASDDYTTNPGTFMYCIGFMHINNYWLNHYLYTYFSVWRKRA